MEVNSGYKQTDIGLIPKDWSVQQLSEGIRLSSGYHVLAKHCNTDGEGIPYITGPADFPNGVIHNTKFTTKPGAICSADDILVTVKGSGAGTIVLANGRYCISRQLMAVGVQRWSKKYIYYSLLRNTAFFGAAATGLIPGLSRSDILNTTIPLPPTIAEQEAIAEALSDADALIEALEQLIAKKRQVKQGAMQELLTGKQRLTKFDDKQGYKQTELGLIPTTWDVVPIASLLEKGTRITYGVVQPGVNVDNGVWFIRGGDIYAGKIDIGHLRKISHSISNSYKRTLLQGGEILISLVGYPGEAAIVPDSLAGANIARQAALIRLNKDKPVSAKYVCYFLLSNMGKRLLLNETFGSAQQVINLKDINKLVVIFPREKEEQTAIAEILSDMDAEIAALEGKLSKARQVKQGMMSVLLTGRVRLV